MINWRVIPDVIGDGVSDQQEIMAAICEAKGAGFDGTDCVGDLNDSTVYVSPTLAGAKYTPSSVHEVCPLTRAVG